MSNCHTPSTIHIEKDKGKKLVLAGNPNVGKSVFFNKMTGLYVDVSNYPGTTVDISSGKFMGYTVMDTPGVYGVSSFNEEEIVARDVILNADLVLNVVDAVHLDRDLFLTKQLIDMGKPIIVALNMMDEVKRNGLEIDIKKLEKVLGVPVIPTVAAKGTGVDEVINRLDDARIGIRNPELEVKIKGMKPAVDNEAEALLILEDDPYIAEKYNMVEMGFRDEIYINRRSEINDIIKEVLKETNRGASLSILLGRWMLRPATGIPMLA